MTTLAEVLTAIHQGSIVMGTQVGVSLQKAMDDFSAALGAGTACIGDLRKSLAAAEGRRDLLEKRAETTLRKSADAADYVRGRGDALLTYLDDVGTAVEKFHARMSAHLDAALGKADRVVAEVALFKQEALPPVAFSTSLRAVSKADDGAWGRRQ
jgi:ABC-type transporter Mla subunit MlaD